MKTPMQELIKSLKAEQMIASNEWQMGYQKALSNVISEAESMLEKEKEVIVKTYNTAALHGMLVELKKEEVVSAQQYYNETFNTNEK